MKLNLSSVRLAAGCCFAVSSFSLMAQSTPFYLDVSGGVALADDVKLKSFVTPTPGTKLELDPGIRMSFAGGYNINDYLAVQAETGYIYNNIDGTTRGGDMDGGLSHVPLLVDFVVRYDKPNCNFVPFAGIGAGGDATMIDLDHARGPNGVIVDGSDGALAFAWQAFGGVRYRLNDKMSIGAVYKYYWADGAEWDVEYTAGDIKTDNAAVHSISVDFTMKF